MTVPPLSGPVRVVVGARTDRGRVRPENQDDFLVADLTVPASEGGLLLSGSGAERGEGGVDSSRITLGPRGALLLVADGMGGGAGGGLASRLAAGRIHEELVRAWAGNPEIHLERFASCLRRAVEAANDQIFRHSVETPELREMGTTATVAGILDDVLILAQVGDSRGYLVREGAVVQLTRDQSVVQALVEAGTLTAEEARTSPRRNLILQALGPRPEVVVEVTRQTLRRGDTLLLCSDGLSGMLEGEDIARIVSSSPDPSTACTALVALANERGGADNITAVVAVLKGEGLALPSALDEIGTEPFPDAE